jgi:hypothetical protein
VSQTSMTPLSSDFTVSITPKEPIRFQICQISNLSDIKPCQILNLSNIEYCISDIEPMRYQTYLIPNHLIRKLSDTEPIRWPNLSDNKIPSLSDTKPIRHQTYQITNLADTKPIWYRTYYCRTDLSDTEPIRGRTVSPLPVHIPRWPPTPPRAP